MTTQTIEDLRAHLFAAIAGVRDGTLDIGRAKAVGELAQTVINSAKVEVEYLRVVDADRSTFLGAPPDSPTLPNGITGVVKHRLQG